MGVLGVYAWFRCVADFCGFLWGDIIWDLWLCCGFGGSGVGFGVSSGGLLVMSVSRWGFVFCRVGWFSYFAVVSGGGFWVSRVGFGCWVGLLVTWFGF